MAWTYEHDIFLCKEILIDEPFRFKAGTREKGAGVGQDCQNVTKKWTGLRFSVNQRGVTE